MNIESLTAANCIITHLVFTNELLSRHVDKAEISGVSHHFLVEWLDLIDLFAQTVSVPGYIQQVGIQAALS